MLIERNIVKWNSVFNVDCAEDGLERLRSINRKFNLGSDEHSMELAASVTQDALQQPGFLAILFDVTASSLSESICPFDLCYERRTLLSLMLGAAINEPVRFQTHAGIQHLRELLIRSTQDEFTWSGRADSIRLLGYMRHLSLEMLPHLRRALGDVYPVRAAALETARLFRSMDQEVLPLIREWLNDDSGVIAFSAAHLFTTIGRHARITSRNSSMTSGIHRDIVQILSDAVRDPRSRRDLDFGLRPPLMPHIPRLCDFLFDCMLTVAGFAESGRP